MFWSCDYRSTCTFLIFIVAVSSKTSPSSTSPWATYNTGKSVYTKSLGPPNGLDTITVPYGPKMSSFSPKFVDPKTMISSKTNFLSNLFGGMGPVNYPFSAPVLYASNIGDKSPYEISDLENIIPGDKNIKRSIFGPMSGEFDSSMAYGQFTPKFTSESNFPYVDTKSKFSTSFKRKRSIITEKPPTLLNLKSPPLYPVLNTITEESDNVPASVGVSKKFIADMFRPFEQYKITPSSLMFSPSSFASTKTTFLNTLFPTLTTSTPKSLTSIPVARSTSVLPNFWSTFETTTDIPMPKSTIVPPDFWVPSSIIPTSEEYTDKVSSFLNKLVESIKLDKMKTAENTTSNGSKSNFARSLIDDTINKTKITNSIDDLTTITVAKDAIIDSIITELGSLKTNMINNFNELLLAEKSAIASSSVSKKPVKPFKAAFAGLWGLPPPPPIDSTFIFGEKMSTLSEVFDMLIELQKNITTVVSNAIKNRAIITDILPLAIIDASAEMAPKIENSYLPANTNVMLPSLNVSFWDAIKNKLINSDESQFSSPPLWSINSQSDTVKRHVNNEDYDFYDDNQHYNENTNNFKRGVQMSMRQGYQNIPPGTVETIQAGGGSVTGHQGSGIKLLNSPSTDENNDESWKEWARRGEYIKKQYGKNRHHHNYH